MIKDELSLGIIELPSEFYMKEITPDLVLPENKEMAKEFICIICKNILYNPVSCQKCLSLFCKICAENIIKNQKNCPSNCSGILKTQPADKNTKNFIGKIKLKCPKNNNICKEIIQYEFMETHLKNCVFKKFKCEFCTFSGNSEECKDHLKSCPFSSMECKNCDEVFHKRKEKLHTSKICLEKIKEKKKLLNEVLEMKLKESEALKAELNIYKVSKEEIEKHSSDMDKKDMNLFSIGSTGLFKNTIINSEFLNPSYLLSLKNDLNIGKEINSYYFYNIKYIDQFNSVIINKKDSEQLILANLQQKSIYKFPPYSNMIFTDWFIIKNKNIICLAANNLLQFYNVLDGSLISEIRIPLKISDKIIYNEKLTSIIFVFENLIKVYKLYITENEISIQLMTTHEKEYDIGCYLKSDHNFLSINESIIKVINLNVIDSNNCVIMKRDLNYKINSKVCICLYTKENSQIILNDDTNLLFINYKNGDFNKIIKNAHNSEIIKLKKAKLNQIRVLLTGDQNNNIKIWDVFNYVLISTFNTGCKIYQIEFAKSDEVVLILDDNVNIKGWKLK